MNTDAAPSNPPKKSNRLFGTRESAISKYVAILEKAEVGSVENPHNIEENEERRLVKELIDQGLLSERRSNVGIGMTFVQNVVLTPAGAIALCDWSEYIESKSVLHKTLSFFDKAFWAIIGAICTILPDIIKSILHIST